MLNDDYKISEEVAISDVKVFLEYHTRANWDDEKINKEHPELVEAVRKGLLVFDEKQIPTLTLEEPVMTLNGDIDTSSVTFRTRIVASEQQKLAKGIDMKLDGVLFLHKCIAYLTNQKSVAYLDKFGKFDYKRIESISTLFI